MSLRIRIDHGQDAGKTWRLKGSGIYVIGRALENAIHVLDMKVSKEHSRILVQVDGERVKATLEDLGSRHGTLLNAQPLRSQAKPLRVGDEIRVGLSILRVLSDGQADVEVEGRLGNEAAVPTSTEDKAGGTRPKPRKAFPPDELVNEEVGGYKVLRKIGQGGMGSVYVAEQMSLHREVAFKVLSDKFTSDSTFVDQFVNEARSAAALNHPNVVQVYDVGRENGRYYFSMEFVPGGSIEERLAEDGAQTWQDGLNWMIDAANALIFAEKREILHRDVKPDNLMLAEDGSAKLCDLGLAKKAANEDMLAAGIIGTPAFISPEAIRRKKDIDARSDLYSLGCTFYRVLTRENPYPAKTVKEILLGHLKGPIPRVSDKKPNIPRDLDEAIYQLMQKEADDRFQSPEDLLQALDKIRIQHGLEAHGIRPASRKPFIIAVAVLVLILGGVIFALTGPKNDTPTGPDAKTLKAQKDAEARADAAIFTAFQATAEGNLAKLRQQKSEGALDVGDNWAKLTWETLATKFDTYAQELEGNEKYGDREDIKDLAGAARSEAKDIRYTVKVRRQLDTTVKTARTTALAELRARLDKIRTETESAVRAGAWVKAWTLLDPEKIDEAIAPLRERKAEDVLPATVSAEDRRRVKGLLLDDENQIQPLVAEVLAGDPVGEELRTSILTALRTKRRAAMATAREAMETKTHEGYLRAASDMETYLETLPEGLGEELGSLATLVTELRAEAEKLLEQAEKAERRLLCSEICRDQEAYARLVTMLRRPETGYVPLFRFADAAKAVAAEKPSMSYPGYVKLTQALEEDVAALKALFDRMREAHPKGWTTDRLQVVDEKGKTQTVKVKEVRADGLKLGSDERTFAQLGADWLLHNLYYVKGGEPLFAFEGEDHRGLAVLAEVAVDYDLASKHYQAYLTTLDPERLDTQEAMRRRLGSLALEKDAGEAWKLAVERWSTVAGFLRLHDPRFIGDEAFADRELRKELLDRRSELNRLLQEARAAEATLRDPRYATTVWSTVIRETPDPQARYAGEPVIEDEPEKEPEKAPEKEPEKAPENDEGKAPGEDDPE